MNRPLRFIFSGFSHARDQVFVSSFSRVPSLPGGSPARWLLSGDSTLGLRRLRSIILGSHRLGTPHRLVCSALGLLEPALYSPVLACPDQRKPGLDPDGNEANLQRDWEGADIALMLSLDMN